MDGTRGIALLGRRAGGQMSVRVKPKREAWMTCVPVHAERPLAAAWEDGLRGQRDVPESEPRGTFHSGRDLGIGGRATFLHRVSP